MLKINNLIEQNLSMGNTFSKIQQIKSHYQSPVVTYKCLSSTWMTEKIVFFVTISPTLPPQKIFLSDWPFADFVRAVTTAVHSLGQLLYSVQKTLFWEAIHHQWLRLPFTLSSGKISQSCGEECDIYISFSDEHSTVFSVCWPVDGHPINCHLP